MTARDEALARLKAAPWLTAAPLGRVFAALGADKGATRVVGGAVRDTLLGIDRAVMEVDLATTLLPDDVTARAGKAGIAAIPTGIAFGTVTLVLDETSFEVTSLRHDVETDGRHAVVRFGSDWAEDAARRDFTLNALYCDADGNLLDPLGGLEDCLARRVRFIGDASQRINEDRLRVFRFFRFSASHGGERFDEAGLAASAAAAAALGRLSAERIGHEMTRILALPKCATTLGTMSGAGILDLDADMLARLQGYERLAENPDLAGRLAILAGASGAKGFKQRWRLSNALVKQVETIAAAARLIASGRLAEAVYRHPEARKTATAVAAAEKGWTRTRREEIDSKLAAFAPPPFPVTGALLLANGFPSGPDLGRMLAKLEAAWIDSAFSLDREALLALARRERP